MAGRPLGRQREATRRDRALAGMASPRIPMDVWRRMTDSEKFAVIAGFSLDDALLFQSIPFEYADIHERSARLSIFLTMVKIGAAVFRESERRTERLEILEELEAKLRNGEAST